MFSRPSRLIQVFVFSLALQLAFASATFAYSNMIANPGFETGSFSGWTKVDGGDGWAISGDMHSGTYSVAGSYEYGTLTQVVDLVGQGFSEDFLDDEIPLDFSTYVKGINSGSSTEDYYSVTVILQNASHVEMTRFATGDLRTTSVWQEISHTFSDYGSNLRFVSVELRGKDANWWLGNYGPTFDDTTLAFSETGGDASGSVPFPVTGTTGGSSSDDESELSEESEHPFVDVNSEEEHQTAVEYLYSLGILEGYEMSGTEDREFLPFKSINRAEFLKMTMLLVDTEWVESENCFSDVSDQWFASYVCSAFEKGIVTGYGDNTFKPEQIITFEEMFAIALRTFDLEPDSTVEGEAWYEVYWDTMEELELLTEITPILNQDTSRGEAVQLLYNITVKE